MLLPVYFHSFRHPLSVYVSASSLPPPSGSCFLFVFVWRDPRRAGDYTSLKFKSETSVAEYNGESLKKDWFNVEKKKKIDYAP